jgi:outer membrane protein TolC
MQPTSPSVFENHFHNLSYGVTLDIPFRNRSAQADAVRAWLARRPYQLKMQDVKNQDVWDVNKAVSAITQATDSLVASLKLDELAHRVLELRQNKVTQGSATAEDVIAEQQNLSIAEGHVVRARATYAKALIQEPFSTGITLHCQRMSVGKATEYPILWALLNRPIREPDLGTADSACRISTPKPPSENQDTLSQ